MCHSMFQKIFIFLFWQNALSLVTKFGQSKQWNLPNFCAKFWPWKNRQDQVQSRPKFPENYQFKRYHITYNGICELKNQEIRCRILARNYCRHCLQLWPSAGFQGIRWTHVLYAARYDMAACCWPDTLSMHLCA